MIDVRIPIIIGVTGHRDLPREDTNVLRIFIRQLFEQLKRDYPNSPFKLISGLAEGADRLVAEVALDLGFSLLAALPMPPTDYEQDFESPQSLEDFRNLVAKAESCFVVPQDADLANTEPSRDLKYLALGRYIARHSQIVVALWDGVSEQVAPDGSKQILTGGTADVVRLCRSGLFSESSDQIVLPEVTWLEHLWVRRQGRPLPNGDVGHWARDIDVGSANGYESSKKRISAVLSSIDKFNACACNLPPAQTQQSCDWLLGGNPPQEVTTYLARPLACFAAADAAAGQRQAERAKAIKWISGLAVVSIICQQVYSGPDMRWGWLAAHITLAMLAFFEYTRYFTRDNPREQQYMDWRSLAEALRVQVFWLASGVRSSVADHYLSGDRDELDWIRQAARNTTVGVMPMFDQKIVGWARNAWLESQHGYFQKKSPENGNKVRQFGKLTSASFVLALFITISTLVAHLMDVTDPALNMFVLASGVCFLGSAVLKTYAEQMAFEEQKNRYHVMGETYKTALARYDGHLSQNDFGRAREVLLLIGKEALTENAGWLRLHRQRQFEVTVA
jgi:hypothetical protein